MERIEHKEKHWKFSNDDITARAFWKEYQAAYQDALSYTSTKIAPWYVIPADDKKYAHQLIGKIILEKLKSMKPTFPPVTKAERVLMKAAKAKLKKESK